MVQVIGNPMEIAKHCTAYLSVLFFELFLLPTESPVKSQQSVNSLFAYPNSPLLSQPYIFLLPSLDLVHVFQFSLFPVRFFFNIGLAKKVHSGFSICYRKTQTNFLGNPVFSACTFFSCSFHFLLFEWLNWWLIRVCPQCRRLGFNPWVRKIPWRREGQPAPIFLPGKSHGQRRLAGHSPWGRKKLGHDWAINTSTLWMKQTGPVRRQTCACFICCICLAIRGQWSIPLPEFYICTLYFYWMGSL